MRISAKGRYTLAATIEIARHWGSDINISSLKISTALGISKIFLDQCLGALKSAGILVAAKGQSGGYRLARGPKEITTWDILSVIETSLQEKRDGTCSDPSIENAIGIAFSKLDKAVENTLSEITLEELVSLASTKDAEDSFMLYF